MQLILDDEIWRARAPGSVSPYPEQCPRLRAEREHRELVDGPNYKRRPVLVNVLVDDVDRKRRVKVAQAVGAAQDDGLLSRYIPRDLRLGASPPYAALPGRLDRTHLG